MSSFTGRIVTFQQRKVCLEKQSPSLVMARNLVQDHLGVVKLDIYMYIKRCFLRLMDDAQRKFFTFFP